MAKSLKALPNTPTGHPMIRDRNAPDGGVATVLDEPLNDGRSRRPSLPTFATTSGLGDAPRASFGQPPRQRGAVAVETAIMLPVLFFLFFGIVEFGLFWQSDHTINEASRTGARLGATLARELDYHEDIVAAVQTSIGNNIPSGSVKYLTIYKADPSTGDPVTGAVLTCSVDCWRYTWDDVNREFDLVVGPTWVASEQAACGESGHNDYMGVYVQGEYSSVTGMFGSTRSISESSVIRLEPVPLSNTCEP